MLARWHRCWRARVAAPAHYLDGVGRRKLQSLSPSPEMSFTRASLPVRVCTARRHRTTCATRVHSPLPTGLPSASSRPDLARGRAGRISDAPLQFGFRHRRRAPFYAGSQSDFSSPARRPAAAGSNSRRSLAIDDARTLECWHRSVAHHAAAVPRRRSRPWPARAAARSPAARRT